MTPAVLLQVGASVVVSLGVVLGAAVFRRFVSKRFSKIGGTEAQDRLNAVRKELDDAMTQKIDLLQEQFVACKGRLIEVEAQLKRMSQERIDLKQEIADLHDEIRSLRPRRRAANAE